MMGLPSSMMAAAEDWQATLDGEDRAACGSEGRSPDGRHQLAALTFYVHFDPAGAAHLGSLLDGDVDRREVAPQSRSTGS